MSAGNDADRLTERLVGWEPDETGTLLFVVRASEVLLIRKKRGHGAGKINGPGGKIEPGETPLASARRETREETGVDALDAALAGQFRFVELNGPQWYGYVFVAHRFSGTPHETAEADPFWCRIDSLPFDEMWEDDRHWLPRVLAGERLTGDFLFDDGRLLAHRLETLPAS
ncbi:MAG TPA: 8-oxo-dGTP diphosphatase [Pseudomonadales bacterium]